MEGRPSINPAAEWPLARWNVGAIKMDLMMTTVVLPGGEEIPAQGQGTWMMGERHERRADEIAALREGVRLGMMIIDTAELYGGVAAEILIGEALGDRREELFLVSKAYPQNASRKRLAIACKASLRRLGTERLDLYLLHWRGSVPLGAPAVQRGGPNRLYLDPDPANTTALRERRPGPVRLTD